MPLSTKERKLYPIPQHLYLYPTNHIKIPILPIYQFTSPPQDFQYKKVFGNNILNNYFACQDENGERMKNWKQTYNICHKERRTL